MKKKICLMSICSLLFASLVFAQPSTIVMTAADNCTAELLLPRGDRLNIKIIPNSNSDMTIDLENKFEDESSWAHVDDWIITGASEDQVNRTATPEQESVWYRLRCSDWTAGNCTTRIGH